MFHIREIGEILSRRVQITSHVTRLTDRSDVRCVSASVRFRRRIKFLPTVASGDQCDLCDHSIARGWQPRLAGCARSVRRRSVPRDVQCDGGVRRLTYNTASAGEESSKTVRKYCGGNGGRGATSGLGETSQQVDRKVNGIGQINLQIHLAMASLKDLKKCNALIYL
ncbi:uncharacterized protein LOC105198624 isoform X1 [Solenopsis invicta]|uniref:uncharacterized protein LOC105198624 isoform X1 n=1 Tax=Solenopsis invicta TaxID=13686 RepID=UPI00193D497A|nr:uncharacterized protein LOC105198624 isoform X1 [Solenopsis invicta]